MIRGEYYFNTRTTDYVKMTFICISKIPYFRQFSSFIYDTILKFKTDSNSTKDSVSNCIFRIFVKFKHKPKVVQLNIKYN